MAAALSSESRSFFCYWEKLEILENLEVLEILENLEVIEK